MRTYKHNLFPAMVVILALLAILAAGCSSQSTPAPESSPSTPVIPSASPVHVQPSPSAQPEKVEKVKVGIVTGLSGQLSVYCLPAAEGIQFVIDEINHNGGVKSLGGAEIELIKADDKGDPSVAPAEMERLITQEKVVANFEGPAGFLQQALAPIGDKNQVAQICVGAYDSSIPPKGYNFWYAAAQSIHPANTVAYLKLFDSLVNDYEVKADKIAIISYDDPATQNVREGLKEGLDERGVTSRLVLDEVHPMRASSLDSYAVKIKSADPDILFIANSGYQVNMLYKAFDSLEYWPSIMISVGANEETVRAALGEDLAVKSMDRPGVFSLGTNWVIPEYQPIADFAARAQAKGLNTTPGFISGAQAMYVLYEALEDAASIDPLAVNQALKNVHIPEGPSLITYTYLPEFKFNADGTPVNANLSGAQWQDGKTAIVRPFNYGKEPILPGVVPSN